MQAVDLTGCGDGAPGGVGAALVQLALLRGANVVADEKLAQWLDLMRCGGRCVTAGAVSGPMVRVDWRTLYLQQLSLFGVTMVTAADPRVIADHIEAGRRPRPGQDLAVVVHQAL